MVRWTCIHTLTCPHTHSYAHVTYAHPHTFTYAHPYTFTYAHPHTFTYIHIPAHVIYTHMHRLYDRFTGECVWECEDCEGSGTHLWTAPPHHCGVFSGSGVWVVRAKKVADHAHFLAQSLFPITTNADEVCVCVCGGATLCCDCPLSFPQTTPGDYLTNGRLLAAELCSLWGMHLLATKYSLEAAHFTSRVSSSEPSHNSSKHSVVAKRVSCFLLCFLSKRLVITGHPSSASPMR